MKHKLSLIYSWFVRVTFSLFPDIPFIMRIRGWLYSLFMKESGHNFQVSFNTIIKGLENISVGNNCYLASGVILDASTSVIFEDDVMIGYGAIIITGNHTIKNNSYRFGAPSRKPIFIHKGSWIGANSIILSGSSIPACSCIAAGTVINKKLTENGVYYRNCKIIRKE